MLRWSGYEGTTDNRPSLFVGAYTAVTKRLWEEALQTRGPPCRDAPLPDIVPKPPQITSVEYPFTEDRELYEMVRPECAMHHGRAITHQYIHRTIQTEATYPHAEVG